jgi:hypothetical protein
MLGFDPVLDHSVISCSVTFEKIRRSLNDLDSVLIQKDFVERFLVGQLSFLQPVSV